MNVDRIRDELFDKTEISNLFILRYLPSLDGEAVRLYLYLQYLSCNEHECTKESMASILNVDISVIDAALVQLGAAGIVLYDGKSITMANLGRREVDNSYTPRTSKAPSDRADTSATGELGEAERAKVQMLRAVSDRFFAGQMPTSWYGEIDLWIEKYGFAPEVVYMLFQHCAKSNAVTKPYTRRVADSWGGRFHIRTSEQLEVYFRSYDEYRAVRSEIAKRLKLPAPLSDYQCEQFIDKWFYTYEYRMDIISLAFKEAASHMSQSFNLYDRILTDWYEHGLKTAADVKEYLERRNKEKREAKAAGANAGGTGGSGVGAGMGGQRGTGAKKPVAPQRDNSPQRVYKDEFFDQLYKET